MTGRLAANPSSTRTTSKNRGPARLVGEAVAQHPLGILAVDDQEEPRLLALPARAGGGDALGGGLALIESLHVATGAAAGALLGSRKRAALAGPLMHAVLDVVPHQDIDSRRFEISSALVLIALFAATRGPLDPAVIGAITSSAPDLEHILPLPRPGGRKLFPPHRWSRLHQRGGVPSSVQLLVAGVIAGFLISRRRRDPGETM